MWWCVVCGGGGGVCSQRSLETRNRGSRTGRGLNGLSGEGEKPGGFLSSFHSYLGASVRGKFTPPPLPPHNFHGQTPGIVDNGGINYLVHFQPLCANGEFAFGMVILCHETASGGSAASQTTGCRSLTHMEPKGFRFAITFARGVGD